MGVENVVADHLSRLVPESTSHGLPIGDSFPGDRTNSTPLELSTKEEIFGRH